MADVVTLGEMLIDFVPTTIGTKLIDTPAFKKAPGGAPANVAVGLSRLGVSSAFLGKVGADAFGAFLQKVLDDNGVDTGGLVFTDQARTALAFVSLLPDGERDFLFYRHPSADMLYEPSEVDHERIRQAKILHFGSISLIDEPSRSATLAALATAKDHNVLVSYDPNLRLALWPDANTAREGILSVWDLANVIKVSEEELIFLAGHDSIDRAVQSLWHERLKLLVVTQGPKGCRYETGSFSGYVPGFIVRAIDTTGAGDGFVAGLLVGLCHDPDVIFEEHRLSQVCKFANAVGALTSTQLGAIPALPSLDQVETFLNFGGDIID